MASTDRDVVMTTPTNVLGMRTAAPPLLHAISARSTELRYRVETDTVATTIYLAGSLRGRDASLLRGILRGCLAETPSVIIADLTGLRVVDQGALIEFGSLALDGTWWPGSELLIAGAPHTTHALFARHHARFGRCFATLDEACAAAAGKSTPQRFREELRPDQGRAGWLVRRMIAEACATWEMGALIGAVHITGAELVANAARHAGTDIALTLALRPNALHLAVRDGSHESPKIHRLPHPVTHRTRGLQRIEETTDGWGVTELTDGKLVWASWNTPTRDNG